MWLRGIISRIDFQFDMHFGAYSVPLAETIRLPFAHVKYKDIDNKNTLIRYEE